MDLINIGPLDVVRGKVVLLSGKHSFQIEGLYNDPLMERFLLLDGKRYSTQGDFLNLLSCKLYQKIGEPLQVLEFSIVRRSDYVLKNFSPKGVKIFEAS
jgi:hypothetical protein